MLFKPYVVPCCLHLIRSLSGSLIQASQMLTLGFPHSDIVATRLWGNETNLADLVGV